jgi:putative transposase
LLTDHISLLRDSVWRVKRLYPFHIDVRVVLPDHLHCVLTLPPDTDDFPVRWRLIKLLFSKGLPRTERLSATRRKRAERGIWQRRYWEHTITKELDYAKHIDYIHVNPLKHGYVNRVQDWPYSTFHHYVRDGILVGDYFSDLIRAVDNWYTEISNYFDCRVTNAFTECVNKGIARQCRVRYYGPGLCLPMPNIS